MSTQDVIFLQFLDEQEEIIKGNYNLCSAFFWLILWNYAHTCMCLCEELWYIPVGTQRKPGDFLLCWWPGSHNRSKWGCSFPDVKPNQSISLKKCGHWGEPVCHRTSRCSFPGVNFFFPFFYSFFFFVSLLTLGLPQGIFWLCDRETLKKSWILLRFLLLLQMCLLRRPFVYTGAAFLSFWAFLLFLDTQQTSFPHESLAWLVSQRYITKLFTLQVALATAQDCVWSSGSDVRIS